MTRRTWLITGVSSGLGRSMTELLLEQGDRVVGTSRRPTALDDLKTRYGDALWLEPLDVTDTLAIRAVVARAFAALGRIDVVVSNAGYGILGAAEELTDDQIDRQIATNLVGSIQVVRAVVPYLRSQGGGRIIQISTMGGQAVFPAGSLYHASKWGIEGFMESIRHELAPFGIGVTIVEPGSTGTNFGRNLVIADPLDAYADGPVGRARAFFGDGTYASPGDAGKTARAIVDSAGMDPAPLRLATGKDAYAAIHAALTARLAELEARKPVAFSTDRD
jgi:NAD(P)-dependent dehydrogenase (short-subunit alcohol dehydrogenase family)